MAELHTTDDGSDRTLTRERVFSLCEVLLAEGKPVTQRNILTANGGKGSNTTIVKYLGQWKESRAKSQIKAPELPDTITNAILDHIAIEIRNGLTQAAQDLAEREQEVNDLIVDNDELNANLKRQAVLIEETTKENERHKGLITRLMLDISTAQAQAAKERENAEVARRELSLVTQRLEALPELQAELKEKTGILENVRSQLSTTERDLAVTKQQLLEAQQRAAEALAAHVAELAAVKENVAMRVELEAAKAALTKAQVAHDPKPAGDSSASGPKPSKTTARK